MSTIVAPGTTFSGSRVIESGRALADAVKSGNWLDGGMAFLDTLGDAAAALTDPIGTLTACGLGWVMEHLKPLSTWLDQLAGSASNVASVASQWVSAGSSMRQAGADLSRRLSDLEGMTGGSITAYVRFATDAAKHLGASGEWAEAAASGLTSASTLVTKMQGVVKSAISKVVATAIEAMAVVAASFGLGMGYAIARVVMKVNEMVNKVVRPLRAVLGSVKALTGSCSSFAASSIARRPRPLRPCRTAPRPSASTRGPSSTRRTPPATETALPTTSPSRVSVPTGSSTAPSPFRASTPRGTSTSAAPGPCPAPPRPMGRSSARPPSAGPAARAARSVG